MLFAYWLVFLRQDKKVFLDRLAWPKGKAWNLPLLYLHLACQNNAGGNKAGVAGMARRQSAQRWLGQRKSCIRPCPLRLTRDGKRSLPEIWIDQKFLDNPPPGIELLREHSVVADDTVSMLFAIPGVAEILENCELAGCLLDWTY